MGDKVSPQALNQIAETLVASCTSVMEFDRRTALATWRDWNEAFPLAPKQHRAILEATVVNRMSSVPTKLWGRHAIQAYESQSGFGVIVLCDGALVGWSCSGPRVPRLDAVDANIVITNITFDWTYGMHAKWRRTLDWPVFLDREMCARAGFASVSEPD
jgi:hypothetical protein